MHVRVRAAFFVSLLGLCVWLVGGHEFGFTARLRHPFLHRGQRKQRSGGALRLRRQADRISGEARGHRRIKRIGNGELPDLTRSPEAFGELIRSEYERWGAIVRPMNLNL